MFISPSDTNFIKSVFVMVNSAKFCSLIFESLVKINDAYELECPIDDVQHQLRSASVCLLNTVDSIKSQVLESFDLTEDGNS